MLDLIVSDVRNLCQMMVLQGNNMMFIRYLPFFNSNFISYAEIDKHSNDTWTFKNMLRYIGALNLNVQNGLKHP